MTISTLVTQLPCWVGKWCWYGMLIWHESRHIIIFFNFDIPLFYLQKSLNYHFSNFKHHQKYHFLIFSLLFHDVSSRTSSSQISISPYTLCSSLTTFCLIWGLELQNGFILKLNRVCLIASQLVGLIQCKDKLQDFCYEHMYAETRANNI